MTCRSDGPRPAWKNPWIWAQFLFVVTFGPLVGLWPTYGPPAPNPQNTPYHPPGRGSPKKEAERAR